MIIDLSLLSNETRLLLTVPLEPLQGTRFQPTGFPSLGAATFQAPDGQRLLVESAQSMANRLETTCWDSATNKPVEALSGISHVVVERKGKLLTDSMLEAHRLNSPYLLLSDDRSLLDPLLESLRSELGKPTVDADEGYIDRTGLARVLLKFDVGSLIHGCFLSNKVRLSAADSKAKSMAGGRLRVARALSAFIQASGVQVAASGGVKNDRVHPSGEASDGFGNVPFARDEYTAKSINLFVNLDLAQIRGFGLGADVERMLILLALYRVRKLLDGDLRLRTACDFKVATSDPIKADRPRGFMLPSLPDLEKDVREAIKACSGQMVTSTVTFDAELKRGKDSSAEGAPEAEADEEAAAEGDED